MPYCISKSFNVVVCVDSINLFIVYVTSCAKYCIFSTIHGCISINIILSYLTLDAQLSPTRLGLADDSRLICRSIGALVKTVKQQA